MSDAGQLAIIEEKLESLEIIDTSRQMNEEPEIQIEPVDEHLLNPRSAEPHLHKSKALNLHTLEHDAQHI